jgi:hypothetical protein
MRAHRIMGVALAGLLLGIPTKGYAEIITFTSRPAWEAAVAGGPTFLEDFQGFTVDTQFRTAPLDLGPFTLLQIGNETATNFIDVPPFFFVTSVNGTTHASMFTDFGRVTVDMTFHTPVFAWGADFGTAASGEMVDLDLFSGTGVLIGTVPVPVNNGFFGFVTSPAEDIGKITFRSRFNVPGVTGEIFGIDNVTEAAVPEPSTLTLFGLAALGLFGYGWRRWKRVA